MSRGVNVTPFKFTEQSKRELLSHLAILLEQDKIKLPNDEGLLAELDAIQWELTDKGKTRIATVEGMTDDRVMSLALAVWGRSTPIQTYYQAHTPHQESKYDGTLPVTVDYKPFFTMEDVAKM
jgi:hypothetical protein